MILLEATELTKSYGNVAAIKGVSFQLERGTALGVIGESGSGKSTLARLLVGLEMPDTGWIRLGDEVLKEARTLAQRRRMQLVFQDSLAALNPKLTIAQSIEDYLYVHAEGDRSFRRNRVLEIIQEVHLSSSLVDRRPADISGGQRQRACIARALVLSPEILIADEPTSALDASVQGQVLNVLIEEKKRGLGLVVISHDINVINCIADKILVMLEGEVVEAGSREKILKFPQHHYTKRLIATHEGLQSGTWT